MSQVLQDTVNPLDFPRDVTRLKGGMTQNK